MKILKYNIYLIKKSKILIKNLKIKMNHFDLFLKIKNLQKDLFMKVKFVKMIFLKVQNLMNLLFFILKVKIIN